MDSREFFLIALSVYKTVSPFAVVAMLFLFLPPPKLLMSNVIAMDYSLGTMLAQHLGHRNFNGFPVNSSCHRALTKSSKYSLLL